MLKFLLLAACATLGYTRSVEPSISGTSGASGALREVLVRSGEQLTLPCQVLTELGKDVSYEWLKDDKPLLPGPKQLIGSDGSLSLPAASLSTEGIYQCLVTSQLGVASSVPSLVKITFLKESKPETKKHTPVRGEPYQLDCPKPDAYPQATVVWQVQQGSAAMAPLVTVRTTTGPNGVLYFSNVTDEDASRTYLCTVTSHPSSSRDVILAKHVIEGLKDNTDTAVKPAVPQYLSSDMVVKEGEQIYIYCVYGGALAPPDYTFEGADVNGDSDPASQRVTRHNRSKGRRLLIRSVQPSDQGAYSCSVRQPDGSLTTHTMRLAVISSPTFTKTAESKIIAKKGEDVVIPCQAKGVPQPRIYWSYNSKPLSAGDRVTFSPTGKSSLKIAGVRKSDAGYYGCRATTEVGEVYTETLVQVA